MSRALKENDVLELSKLYEAEFNQSDLHDRVLVFDVVASWPHGVADVEESGRINNEESIQRNHENESEADKTENKETSVNTDDQNETGSHDRANISNHENDNQHTEMKEGSQCDDDAGNQCDNGDIQIETVGNETVQIENELSNISQEESETEDTSLAESNITDDDRNVNCNQNSEQQNENSSEVSTSKSFESSCPQESKTPNMQSGQSSETSSESNEASHPSSNKFIQQHKLYIHSSWLALQSSYFRSLFFSGMKESSSNEVHVQIAASEEQAHLMLIEAMYKIDILDNASVDELLEVLRLAHKYDVKFVFKKCRYCLQTTVISLDICEQIMRFIKVDNTITDVEDLVSILQSFLAKEFSSLDKTWQTTSFKELCEPSLKYLLSSNELIAYSENTIFHALVYWIEHHGFENVSNGHDQLPSLLSVVRFELIPIDYLYNIVQHSSVAKKLADFNDHYLRGISYHALSDKIRETLTCQPAERKATSELDIFIPYTWVIPRGKLDKLVGTDQELKSDEFWYCGYKMVLTINVIQKEEDSYRQNAGKDVFNATLSLEVINLKPHSTVEISWATKHETLVYHTFKMNACVSSLHIRYKFDKVQPTFSLSLGTQPASSTGIFSCGASAPTQAFPLTFAQPARSIPAAMPKGTQIFSTRAIPATNALQASKAVRKIKRPTTPFLSMDININLL